MAFILSLDGPDFFYKNSLLYHKTLKKTIYPKKYNLNRIDSIASRKKHRYKTYKNYRRNEH